jgi:hypothetical protein
MNVLVDHVKDTPIMQLCSGQSAMDTVMHAKHAGSLWSQQGQQHQIENRKNSSHNNTQNGGA